VSPEVLPDEAIFYDEAGMIFVPEQLLESRPEAADLLAFHESTEIELKMRGYRHAYAHRRSMVAELMAIPGYCPNIRAADEYLRWRFTNHPRWRGSGAHTVIAQVRAEAFSPKPHVKMLLALVREFGP
jgi:hypothetical protein